MSEFVIKFSLISDIDLYCDLHYNLFNAVMKQIEMINGKIFYNKIPNRDLDLRKTYNMSVEKYLT